MGCENKNSPSELHLVTRELGIEHIEKPNKGRHAWRLFQNGDAVRRGTGSMIEKFSAGINLSKELFPAMHEGRKRWK